MIAVVGQRVAEIVRELKGVLCPVRIPSRQSDPNAAARPSFEIGLRMIGTIVNVDPIELSVRAMLPNFYGRRLQHGSNIIGTSSPEAVSLHTYIERLRSESGTLICCSYRTVHRKAGQPE